MRPARTSMPVPLRARTRIPCWMHSWPTCPPAAPCWTWAAGRDWRRPGWPLRAFTVDATDAAPEMVAMAARHDGVTARLAGFDDIERHDLYDGIWANFSLLHAPRRDMPRHLAALRRALKPGGHLHVALKSGTGEARDTLGRFYTYYTEEELHGLLRDAGFAPVSGRTGTGAGLDGTIAPWIAMTAHG